MDSRTPDPSATDPASRLASPESLAAATPMMEQYIEIKLANPDCLLFYRMGDFYELFFDDAEVASRALGITLTRRGKHLGEDIPMCGVPVHAADDYLQKLIALGHRVAVCEQIEDPAEARRRGARSVVQREVVRLVTPGTLTEEKLLAPGESNYLMALARTRASSGFGLAWIELSTGAFRVMQSGPDRLAADILRVQPSELVVAEPVFQDPELKPVFDLVGRIVSPQPPAMFESATAPERIARYFRVAATEGLGDFSRAELAAIGAIIAYVEKTQKSARPELERPVREDAARTLFIDPATRGNLELVRTLSGKRAGSLLAAIDRTVTGAGARLLADRLTAPLTDPQEIAARLDSISFALAEPLLSQEIRRELQQIPDLARALSRLALGRGGPRDLGAIAAALSGAASIAGRLRAHDLPSELQQARLALDALPHELAGHLSRALAADLPLLARDGGFVATGYDPELDSLRELRDQSRRVVAEMQARLAEETGIRSLKIRHNQVLGYYIEIGSSHQHALTGTDEARARFIHRQTMANAMRFTTVELSELESRIANAAGKAIDIEMEIFSRLRAEVTDAADRLRAGAQALAVIDVAFALARLAESGNWCRPEVDASLDFVIEGGRHPVVEQALRHDGRTVFVANDCDLSPDQPGGPGSIWLVTGPNMGGKSTFLRQNALIAILAQMGSFVPASRARIGVVDRLFSRVGASDDLARGRSTFMVEMVETAAILNQAGERSLVILDEIGRGTATFDGLSIAWGTVEYLHEKNRCRTLFATHFHELTALAEQLPRLRNVTMRVKEWDGEVIFLHEVAPGAADRSYGVQVARLAGLPPAVVDRARDVLRQLEEGGGKASRLVDDLPLFSAALRSPPPPRRQSAVEQELANVNPDEMTPREALEFLYRLKQLA